jgi:hypothetical protein
MMLSNPRNWTGLQGYCFSNTAHIAQLKGNVSTSFLTSFVNGQLPHSKWIYDVSPIFKTVQKMCFPNSPIYIGFTTCSLLRNMITTIINPHTSKNEGKKLLQSYLLISYQSIGRKCNGQYEMRNTSVSISGAFAQSLNVPSRFFMSMIPSAHISAAPTWTDCREIWQWGLKISGTYMKTIYDSRGKNISGTNHNVTLYVRCIYRLY